MERLLCSTYKGPERPYSQDELRETRERNLGRLRVGTTMVTHERCSHFYFAKEGGKKEQRMTESNGGDPGYCSVCWKLKKTPDEYREKAANLIDEYLHRFETCPDKWSHYLVDLEKVFYRWLYYEPDRRRKQRREQNRTEIHESVPRDTTRAPNKRSAEFSQPVSDSRTMSTTSAPRRWETGVTTPSPESDSELPDEEES